MFTMMNQRRNRRAALLALALILLGLVAMGAVGSGTARAADLTGSQVVTLERSDDGEIYAALSVVLDLALTAQWSAVLIHDQTVTWRPQWEMIARRVEWDALLTWRPESGWSVSLGRRWRVGPSPDYGGPWTYVQVWRGI